MHDRIRAGLLRLLIPLRDESGQRSVESAGIAFVVVAVAGAIVALAPNTANPSKNAIPDDFADIMTLPPPMVTLVNRSQCGSRR